MRQNAVYTARRVADAGMTAWLQEHALIVEDGRIAAVLPQAQLPAGIRDTHRLHDLGDVSLTPGLVDAHCHMHCSATPDAQALALHEDVPRLLARATSAMRRALLSGATTVRDIGSRNEVAFPIKSAIDDGVIPGPRLICSGTPITTTAGHCWFFGTEADTTEQVVVAIRRQVKLGARVIKMMATGGMFTPTANPRQPQYPVETLAAAVREAERLGVQIVAHTLSAQGVRNCVEAGVHHLIHARWLSADPARGLEYDPKVADAMVHRGLWVDPTIGHHLLGIEARKATGAPDPLPHWSVQGRKVTDLEHRETIQLMHEAGVRFTSGLDMGMPYADHSLSAASAWAFVEWLGWDTWKAMKAATSDTAEALLLGDEIGSLRPGLAADMAAFAGDPAQDIRRLSNATHVIQAGAPVKLSGAALL